MEDLVKKVRWYADDLHSEGGFDGYARVMTLAADEIVKLREYAVGLEADLVATIEQRDALQHKETKMDKELIKLIEENGLTLHGDIEFFAHLVAEREREACAKECEKIERRKWEAMMNGGSMQAIGARDCAHAIRARGEQ